MTGKKKAVVNDKFTRVPLSERAGPLKLSDIKCPICWSILWEPVTPPCGHSACLLCFKRHLEDTSLSCPCCRMRLSLWSRKSAKEDTLVDLKLRERIVREFPALSDARKNGEDSQLLPEDAFISVFEKEDRAKRADPVFPVPTQRAPAKIIVKREKPSPLPSPEKDERNGDGNGCDEPIPIPLPLPPPPGQVREELESVLLVHQEDLERRRKQEESMSQELILRMRTEDESTPPTMTPEQVEADHALAENLAAEEKRARLGEINVRRKLFSEPSSKLQGSPSQGLAKKRPAGDMTMAKGKSPSWVAKKRKISAASTSSNSQNLSQGTLLPFLKSSHSNSPSQSSVSWSSAFAAVNKNKVHPCPPSPIPTPTSTSVIPWRTPRTPRKDEGQPKALLSENEENVGDKTDATEDAVEADKDTVVPGSPDSIDGEVNTHFRPIRVEPKTPPGHSGEPKVVISTPIKKSPYRSSLQHLETSRSHFHSNHTSNCLNDVQVQEPLISGQSQNQNQSHTADKAPADTENVNVPFQVTAETLQAMSLTPDPDDLLIPTAVGPVAGSQSCYILENSYNTPRTESPVQKGASQSLVEEEHSQLQSEDIEDIAFLLEEDCNSDSQKSHELDMALAQQQEKALEEIRAKLLQEEEDRLMAQKLQKELNKAEEMKSDYSLRQKKSSFLTPGSSFRLASSSLTTPSSTTRRKSSRRK